MDTTPKKTSVITTTFTANSIDMTPPVSSAHVNDPVKAQEDKETETQRPIFSGTLISKLLGENEDIRVIVVCDLGTPPRPTLKETVFHPVAIVISDERGFGFLNSSSEDGLVGEKRMKPKKRTSKSDASDHNPQLGKGGATGAAKTGRGALSSTFPPPSSPAQKSPPAAVLSPLLPRCSSVSSHATPASNVLAPTSQTITPQKTTANFSSEVIDSLIHSAALAPSSVLPITTTATTSTPSTVASYLPSQTPNKELTLLRDDVPISVINDEKGNGEGKGVIDRSPSKHTEEELLSLKANTIDEEHTIITPLRMPGIGRGARRGRPPLSLKARLPGRPRIRIEPVPIASSTNVMTPLSNAKEEYHGHASPIFIDSSLHTTPLDTSASTPPPLSSSQVPEDGWPIKARVMRRGEVKASFAFEVKERVVSKILRGKGACEGKEREKREGKKW